MREGGREERNVVNENISILDPIRIPPTKTKDGVGEEAEHLHSLRL
jgi:hypothetical protein